MIFSLTVAIFCFIMGIWGWYEKSTATILGIPCWKINLSLGVLNLGIAASYLPFL